MSIISPNYTFQVISINIKIDYFSTFKADYKSQSPKNSEFSWKVSRTKEYPSYETSSHFIIHCESKQCNTGKGIDNRSTKYISEFRKRSLPISAFLISWCKFNKLTSSSVGEKTELGHRRLGIIPVSIFPTSPRVRFQASTTWLDLTSNHWRYWKCNKTKTPYT